MAAPTGQAWYCSSRGALCCGRPELVPGGLCAAVVDAFRGRNAYSLSSPGLERPKLEGQSASEGSLKGLVLLKVPQHSSANSAVSYVLVQLKTFFLESLRLHYYYYYYFFAV